MQIEKLEDGKPGRYRVTGKMNSGEEFVDEFNTVSCPQSSPIDCKVKFTFSFSGLMEVAELNDHCNSFRSYILVRR